jgi:integrase
MAEISANQMYNTKRITSLCGAAREVCMCLAESTLNKKKMVAQDCVDMFRNYRPNHYAAPHTSWVFLERGCEMITMKFQQVTFDDLCDEYLKYSKTNKAKRSHERDILSVKHLLDVFSNTPADEITAHDVEIYKNRRRNIVKPATVNRELSCIKHMYTKAVQWGFVKNNPLRCVMKFKEPPGRVRYLVRDEIKTLIACCADHLKPIVAMALTTGMRKSEILNLRWSDVDMDNRLITIRKTKNNRMKILPINRILHNTLNKLGPRKDSSYIFTNKDGKPFKQVHRGFKAALRRAGIKDFRFHDLRHTFASHLVMRGVDIRTVQELLGHKNIMMTMRYSHLSNDHLHAAVATLTAKTIKEMPGRRIELRTPGFSVRCSTN